MNWWAVWLFVWTCNLRVARPDVNSSDPDIQARMKRVNVTVECGASRDAVSVISVEEIVDPREPLLQLDQINVECKDELSTFMERNGTTMMKYITYPDDSTLGILNGCAFRGPYDRNGTAWFETIISFHWRDHAFATVVVSCSYNTSLDAARETTLTVSTTPATVDTHSPSALPPTSPGASTTPSALPPAPPGTSTTSASPPPGTSTTPSASPPAPPDTSTTPSALPPPGTSTTPSASPPAPAGTSTTPSASPPPGTSTTPSASPPAPPDTSTTPSALPPPGTSTTPSERPGAPSERPGGPSEPSDPSDGRGSSLGGGSPKHIAEIIPYCSRSGNSNSEKALIQIITDVHMSALAYCRGHIVHFRSTDNVNFYLPVFYETSNASSEDCVFEKKVNSPVYNIRVEISWGERYDHVHTHETYQVTCTFEFYKGQKTLASSSSKRLIASKEIQSNMGPDSSSEIQLDVVNVINNPIVGRIQLGKFIRLRAQSDGTNGELGLRPVSCDVIGVNSGQRYAILRAGCGDGIIFKQNTGFEIKGRETSSPYFKSFSLSSDSQITFKCNFTLCLVNCDGSSCINQRQRRDVVVPTNYSRPKAPSVKPSATAQGGSVTNGGAVTEGVNMQHQRRKRDVLVPRNSSRPNTPSATGQGGSVTNGGAVTEGVNVTQSIHLSSHLSPSTVATDVVGGSNLLLHYGLDRMTLGLIVCIGSVAAVCLGFVGCIFIHRISFCSRAYQRISSIS